MDTVLREARPDDAEAAGRIVHDAFETISGKHNFAKDFPSREAATGVVQALLAHPGYYGVVAERDGAVIGSNFLNERAVIRAVGPITVDPEVQDQHAGRALMQAVLDRAASLDAPGVRLLQDAFHTRSFALYTKLGFRARTTTAVMHGEPPRLKVPGVQVRAATEADIPACNAVCEYVHGYERGGDLEDGIHQGSALVAERGGRITGYSAGLAFFGHSAAETNDDLTALIAAADVYAGPGFHVPTGNDTLLRWCFDHGLRVQKMMTLMTIGLYNEPRGAYLPSVGC